MGNSFTTNLIKFLWITKIFFLFWCTGLILVFCSIYLEKQIGIWKSIGISSWYKHYNYCYNTFPLKIIWKKKCFSLFCAVTLIFSFCNSNFFINKWLSQLLRLWKKIGTNFGILYCKLHFQWAGPMNSPRPTCEWSWALTSNGSIMDYHKYDKSQRLQNLSFLAVLMVTLVLLLSNVEIIYLLPPFLKF